MSSIRNTPVTDTKKLIEWPKHLRTPAELLQKLGDRTKLKIIRSPKCSRIVLQIVGSWAYLVAHVFNKTYVFNFETFQHELRLLENQAADLLTEPETTSNNTTQSQQQQQQRRQKINTIAHGAPLLTYSNHISCIDDPVLWGALLPFNYFLSKTDIVRWSPAAIDICFSKPWHSTFFSLGKTFPIVRGIGVDQPAMEFASALLKHAQWIHLFPEGRVMRDPNQQVISNLDRGYVFKWGISKLILDYFSNTLANKQQSNCDTNSKSIRILPFYHLGLDEILPLGWPYIPRINKKITISIRDSVIEMNAKLLDHILATRSLDALAFKSRSNDEIARIKLTNYLEEELERLVEPATRLHDENKRNIN